MRRMLSTPRALGAQTVESLSEFIAQVPLVELVIEYNYLARPDSTARQRCQLTMLSAWCDPASAMPVRAHFVRANRWSDDHLRPIVASRLHGPGPLKTK